MKTRLMCLLVLIASLVCTPLSYALITIDDDVTSNTTWSEDVSLIGPVFVKSGATLTIEAGVTVFGDKATRAALIVHIRQSRTPIPFVRRLKDGCCSHRTGQSIPLICTSIPAI